MKWLITGGCGFIGTSLIKELITEQGNEIRIVDNLSVGQIPEHLDRPVSKIDVAAITDTLWSGTEIQLIVSDIRDADEALLCA